MTNSSIRIGQLLQRPSPSCKDTFVYYVVVHNRGRDYMNDYREDVWECVSVASEGPKESWHPPGQVVAAAASNWMERSIIISEPSM